MSEGECALDYLRYNYGSRLEALFQTNNKDISKWTDCKV